MTSWVLIATLIWQVIDFLRELSDFKNQKGGIVTQATAWLGGILVLILVAHAGSVGMTKMPGFDLTFHAMNWGDQILFGMMAASLASSAVDLKQAFDNTDSAAKPELIKPTPTP